jgi:trk system potassium uptake protein TrkH
MFCGVEISEAFSGTVASLGNVGPGIGSLGTMGNYAAQPEAAKFIYTVDMLLGRIEIFPILIIISMMFNRKQS